MQHNHTIVTALVGVDTLKMRVEQLEQDHEDIRQV